MMPRLRSASGPALPTGGSTPGTPGTASGPTPGSTGAGASIGAPGSARGATPGSTPGAPDLLEVRGMSVRFRTIAGPVHAVNGLDLSIRAGEIVGLVGESGSGKSVSSRAIMGLLPPRTSTVEGSIRLEGDELVGLPESRYRRVRGERVAMIFQDPLTALDPLYKAGEQVAEALRFHFGLSRPDARTRTIQLFAAVGLSDPAGVVERYPHELSGGMRQRVMIAMALAGEPELLIADEPTTALDVTVQAQILELMRSLVRDRGMALLLITHDLGVVRELCERAIVLYAGRVMEEAPVRELLSAPRHPYTSGLGASIPSILERRRRLPQIQGTPPDPATLPPGCPFAPRCPVALERCATEMPELLETGPGRRTACHRSGELMDGSLTITWGTPT
jgi:oligopeptide/dipeptide ABC transporter ATP-binding protein